MSRTAIQVTQGLKKAERFPISAKRKIGDPSQRPAGKNRLLANEKDYYDGCFAAWEAIPADVIFRQFTSVTQQGISQDVRAEITHYEKFFEAVTLHQIKQSGRMTFNQIRDDVARQWKTLEKAVTPSEYALSLNFNQASPNATNYARLSAANMVTDMVSSQILLVRNLMTRAFTEGLTRRQVSSQLVTLLNEMPAMGLAPGVSGMANIFGEATRGLNQRYANAVYNSATRIMRSNPGMTPEQLKRKTNAYGNRLRRSRARMISRTEIMRASNQGRLDGMMQAADQGLVNPVVAKKQWVTSSFDVCPICVPLNGVTTGLRGTFGQGFQAPPAHPNCRCTVRMLPDPLAYGSPRSVGTGRVDSPLRFVRPEIPGQRIRSIVPGSGVVSPVDGGLPSINNIRSTEIAGKAYKEALEDGTEAATEALVRANKFDAKPKVVDFDELGEFAGQGSTGEMRRLVTSGQRRNPSTGFLEEISPDEIAESYRTGKLFTGEGMYGRGTYVVEGTAEQATAYLSGRQGSKAAHEIIEMTMKPNARVYDMPEKFRFKNRPFGDELHNLVGSNDAHDVLMGLGYDAVRYPDNITVILNRGKGIVGKSRKAKLGDIASFPS